MPIRRRKRPKPTIDPLSPRLVNEPNGTVFIDGGALTAGEPVALGIDPSLTGTGMAMVTASGAWAAWRLHTQTKVDKQGRGQPDRLAEIDRWLTWHFQTWRLRRIQVGHIVKEGPSFGSKGRGHDIGELHGVISLALYRAFPTPLKYPTVVAPQSLKKFILGSANAEKSQILKTVYQRWGVDLPDDNMADAYGLAQVGLAIMGEEVPYAFQQDVLNALKEHTQWAQPPTNTTSPSPSSRRKRSPSSR